MALTIEKSKTMKTIAVISLVFVLLSLAACGQPVAETTDTKEKPAGTEHLVIIDDSSFTPEEIKIKVGDAVTWINQGLQSHTVTSWYSWTDEDQVRYTIVGQIWDSGDIKSGESYIRTFESSGSYDYVTLPLYHYEYFDPGFMGLVVVE